MRKLKEAIWLLITITAFVVAVGPIANAQPLNPLARTVNNGTSDPAFCTPTAVNIFLNRTTPALKICTAANTWTLVGGITQTAADLRYLKLDASNGPLTGDLTLGTQKLSWNSDTILTRGNAAKKFNLGDPTNFATFDLSALTAPRVTTWPDAATFIPIFSQAITFTGPAAARSFAIRDANDTIATFGGVNAFTAANTFAADQTLGAANLLKWGSSGVSTPDTAIQRDGAAKKLCFGDPTNCASFDFSALTAKRIVTFPDAATKIPIATQPVTIAGPTAARTYTFPDAADTIAGLAQGNVFTNTGNTFPAGGGTGTLKPEGVWFRGIDTTSCGTASLGNGADVTEDVVCTVNLPAGTLGTNGQFIRITYNYHAAATTDVKTFRVYFGATVLVNRSGADNNVKVGGYATVVRLGATTQAGTGLLFGPATVGVIASPAETLANAITIKATCQDTTAATANQCVLDDLIVEVLP